MEHSKLPWGTIKIGIAEQFLLMVDADKKPLTDNSGNIPFIVEACNNYERLLTENKAYETNNKNQAKEIDDLYEKIGYLEGLVSKYQETEILRLAGGE